MCAASADEDLDAWFRHKTGLRLRRFLADLRTFEELGEEGARRLGEVNERKGGRRGRKNGVVAGPIKDKGGKGAGNGDGEGRGGSYEGRENDRGGQTSCAMEGDKSGDRKGKGKGKGKEMRTEGGGSRESGYERSCETRSTVSRSWKEEQEGGNGGNSSRTHQHRLGVSGIHEEDAGCDVGAERKRRSGSGRNSIGVSRRAKVGY